MAGSEAEAVEERTYWLAPHGFLSLVFVCFLFFGFFLGGWGCFLLLRLRTTCSGVAPPAVSLPHQSLIKKMLPQASLMGKFSQLRDPLPK